MKNATTKFIVIYLLAIAAMLFFAAKCSAQEITTLEARPWNYKYLQPDTGLFYPLPVKGSDSIWVQVKVPIKRDTTVIRDTIVRYSTVRDTVVIRDTIYITANPPQKLIWSRYNGSFQSFVDSAAKGGLVAYIDRNVTPAATVQIPSNITIEADTNIVVTNPHKILFQLSTATGTQIFKGLRIVQDSIGTAFYRVTPNVSFYDSLFDVQVRGGLNAYESSRGGTASKMAIAAMRNCKFDVGYIAVQVFSQDGPYKSLHLYNTELKTATSHNIYVHPATSLYYDSVACVGAGKLMQHQYSGSGNGGYNTGKYSVFNRVFSNGKAFEMTTLANESPVVITNSVLAPYVTGGIPPAIVHAKNSQFFNAGNGIFLQGVIDSCTGGVWSSGSFPLLIMNSNLKEFSFRGGGILTIANSTVAYMWGADRGQLFAIKLLNCKVGQIWDGKNGDGFIQFVNTPIPNNNLRPDVIK